MSKTSALGLMLCLLLAIPTSTFATTTDSNSTNTNITAYVSSIGLNVAGNTSSFTNFVPYFRFYAVDAAGNNVDACPDVAGYHDNILYIHPSANNKDLMIAMIQMALLNHAELTISTEPNVHSTRTLCFIKQINIKRAQ